jgi:linoleoyl-CoA desaturase
MDNVARVTFGEAGPFYAEVKRRVDQHFEGRSRRDDPRLYSKTLVIFLWFGASYALLMTSQTWWQAVIFGISLGLAMAGIGFNIQHDANHSGYSDRPWVNAALAYSLDIVGGSSYIWSWKHNIFHHSYPNIAGVDSDIDIEPFVRLAPKHQKRKGHRYQHFYVWLLYGFLAVKWHLLDDFHDLITGTIGNQKFPRPKGWRMFSVLLGKAIFFTWAFAIPMIFHPVWMVLLTYAGVSVVLALTLASTFQLAHSVEGADFPEACKETGKVDSDWAAHQVHSTVNFARTNPFWTWYMGGLNFQIEHHLFPKISHSHYPAISKIVEDTCKEYGLRYQAHPTVRAALTSHVSYLRGMGRAEVVVPQAQVQGSAS